MADLEKESVQAHSTLQAVLHGYLLCEVAWFCAVAEQETWPSICLHPFPHFSVLQKLKGKLGIPC